jgi:uncharacterized spore protein YtfJ
MDIRSFLESLAERLQSSAQVKMVYGEPVSAEGKTIIPIAKISYGFGGGFGRSAKSEEEGGGGGGGVTATPLGALEITAQETRFIRFNEPQRFLAAAAAGFLLGALLSRRRKRKNR